MEVSGLGWFTGVLSGSLSWFALNFVGKPFVDFLKLRQEVREELSFLSDVNAPDQQLLYDDREDDYQAEVEKFADARERTKRLGSKLGGFHTSLCWPLRYIVRARYDLDKAERNLVRLFTEAEFDKIIVRRYHIEGALGLPHTNAEFAQAIVRDRARRC
jgi:hypothetical protein